MSFINYIISSENSVDQPVDTLEMRRIDVFI